MRRVARAGCKKGIGDDSERAGVQLDDGGEGGVDLGLVGDHHLPDDVIGDDLASVEAIGDLVLTGSGVDHPPIVPSNATELESNFGSGGVMISSAKSTRRCDLIPEAVMTHTARVVCYSVRAQNVTMAR